MKKAKSSAHDKSNEHDTYEKKGVNCCIQIENKCWNVLNNSYE